MSPQRRQEFELGVNEWVQQLKKRKGRSGKSYNMGKGRDTEIKLWFIWEYITSCETEKGTERSNKREERKIRWGNVKCQVKTVGDRAIVSDKPLNTISSLGHAFLITI